MMRKFLGLVMVLTGLTILAFALVGAYFAGDAIATMEEGLSNSLVRAAQGLEAAGNTLDLSRNSIRDMNAGLNTAVSATANASRTLDESRPLIDNVASVTTQEVPEAVEGMQAALPNLIEVASVIDRTLVTLSSVGIDREIPLPFGGSIPLSFDLGIDYNPETSFDSSLRVFEASLEGLPESLRGMEDDLQATNGSLATLSSDLQAISDDMSTINTRVDELIPLLDQYTLMVDQLSGTVAQMETKIGSYLALARTGVIALLIAVALSQLAPIYLGWELLTGRRALQMQASQEVVQPVNPVPVIQPEGEAAYQMPTAAVDAPKGQATSPDDIQHAQS